MKRLMLFLYALLLSLNTSYSLPAVGDFVVVGTPGYTITGTFEAVSIPYEGCNDINGSYTSFNRLYKIQNGSYYRFFTTSTNFTEYQIAHITATANTVGNVMDLAHTSGYEFPPNGSIDGAWGYAKYKITNDIA